MRRAGAGTPSNETREPTAAAAFVRGGGAQPPRPAEIARVHNALHGIGRHCSKRPTYPDRVALAREAHAILAFARAYPSARFEVDGEQGRTLSLLLVAREALKRCEPRAARSLDAALPTGLRDDDR